MSTRITRSSQRFTENGIKAQVTQEKIVSTRRRQRNNSSSSENLSESPESRTNEAVKRNEINVTPPKQRKPTKNVNGKYSPSTLLNRLNLSEESKDRDENEQQSLKALPAKSKIDDARKVLHTVETEELYGRQSELEEIHQFLETNLNNSTSASMYISGQPGTGKTACVRKMLRPSPLSNKFKKVYINCTKLQTPAAIYQAICTELNIKTVSADKESSLKSILGYICKKNKKMVLLVLDEIDELIEKKQSILYTIFEWPILPKSKIIIIGIANSLDLTNRILSRLQTQSIALKPQLIQFLPYTKQQIVDIFKHRLEAAGVLDVFPLTTIQLLSAKVAAMSGDIRKALDLGRRVAEMAKEKPNLDGIDISELGLTEIDAPPKIEKIGVQEVLSVFNNAYSTANKWDNDNADLIPLQEKILVCTLLMLLKTGKNKDITISRLRGLYAKVCNKRGIPVLDESEFIGICSLTETKGIIRMIKNKVSRLSKIQLQWDEDEITNIIKDKQLIANILSDTSILDK